MKTTIVTTLLLCILGTRFGLYSQDYLNEERFQNIDSMSIIQLQLLRNELFARHGQVFENKLLQEYFDQLPWYLNQKKKVTIDSLTPTEIQMFERIGELEKDPSSHLKLIDSLHELIESYPETATYYLDTWKHNSNSFFFSTSCSYGYKDWDRCFGPLLATTEQNWITPDGGDTTDIPIGYYAYDGIIVYAWNRSIYSVFCYSPKYETYDGFRVGMSIDVVLKTFKIEPPKTRAKGCIRIGCPGISLFIGYENGVIKFLYSRSSSG